MMMMDIERCNQSSGIASEYLLNTTVSGMDSNMTAAYGVDDDLSTKMETFYDFHDGRTLPTYLQITCLILFVVIFTVGTVGNIMVTLVINCSRDMKTSINIFLVNLSIADMLVLVVCTPTALIEVLVHPDRWILGFYMCKFVPLLEATVANTSVLTILAISFKRYYAICRPLRANYVCTKSRAAMICLAAWVMATFITSNIMDAHKMWHRIISEDGEKPGRFSPFMDWTVMMMMDIERCNQSSGIASEYLLNTTVSGMDSNMTAAYGVDDDLSTKMETFYDFHDGRTLPTYLQITCLILFVVIFTVGTVGNIMVTLVINCSRDMKTSINIFLVNLSIADMLVLVVCTPTALIEVLVHPDRWILGFYMCKFVPLLEATVANTSVLTILAISFKRYYAICRPLRANYVCTKSRAAMICLAAWVMATFITSPMMFMISYKEGVNECGDWSARCDVVAGELLPDAYTISTIILLFLVPFFILLVTYGMIARKLTSDRTALNAKNENHKARKQVVVMLGTVVFTFFLCLLPFRVLTLFVILADTEFLSEYKEAYQNFVYFSRIMIYINSALNPILYNIMSSKFRNGFLRLCNRNRKHTFKRTGTFITNTTTNSTNASINLGHQPGANGNSKGNGHCSGHYPLGHSSSLYNKRNGSPSSRPDLLKTLMRTQSNALAGPTTTPTSVDLAAANNAPSIGNSQCIQYYNNHASGNGTQQHYHPGANGITINKVNGCVGGGGASGKKTQTRFNGHHCGTNGISTKLSNNIVPYSNGDYCLNGKVKSDTIYTAYLPGTRSETVL